MAGKHRSIPPLTPQDILRFWEKVRIRGPDECWPWTARRNEDGYGQFSLRRGENRCENSMYAAHRIAWTIADGSIPAGLSVLHHCDNPACINPSHLFLGTQKDNIADAVYKGRMRAPSGDDHWTRRHPERRPRGAMHWAHKHPEWVLRGEKHGRAKLTAEQIREIRQRHAITGISGAALAREYPVCSKVILQILRHEIWTHIV